MVQRQKILITGRVQGVGFRPAVYRLATELGLTGTVVNDTRGVTVEVQGERRRIDEFLDRLRSGPDKPPLAEILSYERVDVQPIEGDVGFTIGSSDSTGAPVSQVAPDTATCGDCLAELRDPGDFRHRYPFINCTNCGPRYSIVRTIPYDRPNTTMAVFPMCARCASQYADVADRRFHAQPVACGACGPSIELVDRAGAVLRSGTDEVIAESARLLREGKILAIKGIGGFHLAVDALNEQAVVRLRQRKHRDHKPFAMMAASVDAIREYAIVDAVAEETLTSPQAPIVLLPKKAGAPIAPSVAEGVATFGFMLCYAPLHALLFAEGLDVLVMTSANISDEPLICKNDVALQRLGEVADAFVMHDREIYRQVDDSIVHVIEGKAVPLRRARGYVPTPILMERDAGPDILATGADLKNTFCLVKGNQLILSEHIGDLEDAEVYRHYVGSIEHLRRLFEVELEVVACDLHPGYLSTHYARALAGVKVVPIQHHWAHIASVLVEHGLDGPVIGIECDGTGYGTDGAIWGCECMIASLTQFERFGHLDYYPLAGADRASKEAVRPLLSLLRQAYGDEFTVDDFAWLLDRVEPSRDKVEMVLQQLDKGVNTVNTSSLGRVFDAVAAVLGLGSYNHFDAELPMALESIVASDVDAHYPFDLIEREGEPVRIDLRRTIRRLVDDIRGGGDPSNPAAKFHNTLAEALLGMAQAARKRTGLNTAAISGGVFCNRYLACRVIRRFREAGFEVLFNRDVPANDGGIALGQAAIAAALCGFSHPMSGADIRKEAGDPDMSEKRRIEKATAEGFVVAYNALMDTSFRFDALLDPPEPDVRCVDADGNSLYLEITMTEDRPGDIKARMGRSEDRSLEALEAHLDAVKAGKASIFDRVSSLCGNVSTAAVQRLRSKLTKRYGPGVALVIRDTSGVDWDWDEVKEHLLSSLDLSKNPYDRGIWILSCSKKRLFRLT